MTIRKTSHGRCFWDSGGAQGENTTVSPCYVSNVDNVTRHYQSASQAPILTSHIHAREVGRANL